MKKSLKVKAKAGWKELSEDDFIAVRIILVFASLVPLLTLSLGENRSSVLVASIILSAGMFVGNVILAGVRKRSGDFLVGFACLISIAINLFFGLD